MFKLANIVIPITPVTNIIIFCFFYITVILTTSISIFIFLIIVTSIILTNRLNFLLTTLFIRRSSYWHIGMNKTELWRLACN